MPFRSQSHRQPAVLSVIVCRVQRDVFLLWIMVMLKGRTDSTRAWPRDEREEVRSKYKNVQTNGYYFNTDTPYAHCMSLVHALPPLQRHRRPLEGAASIKSPPLDPTCNTEYVTTSGAIESRRPISFFYFDLFSPLNKARVEVACPAENQSSFIFRW